jgi:hypothetical protein
MINELNEKGFIHLTNISDTELENILNELGEVIHTTDVIVKPESRGMVTTSLGLDFHTDHHKAKYILWYCHKQTDLGGDSIFIDADKIFSQLTEEEQNELTHIKLFEHKIFPGDKDNNPFVEIDEKGKRIFYYSFWLVKDEDKQNPAFLKFQTFIKETEPTKINLKEKDILIVDNHRIFHGRTAIEGSKDRFLKRYWLTATHNNS